MFGHRGPDIRRLMESLQAGLQTAFKTERPVYIAPCSGTGMMEAAVRNGIGRRGLCLVNGAFSQRFAAIARACGKQIDVLEVAWGETHDPEDVLRALGQGDYDAVTVCHSETSTGALQPLADLADVVTDRDDTLLLVDAVSAAAGVPVLTDQWELDFLLTASQKAMALPPGLAFGVASARMMARAETLPDRGLYFDLVQYEKNFAKLQTPTTPALTLLFALRTQLKRMEEEGMEARWDRHLAMAQRRWAWVDEVRERTGLGLGVLAPPGSRSATVTCITLPEGLAAPEVVAAVRDRGVVIGGGYGKLAPSTVRIGHMGDHTVSEVEAVLAVLEEVLAAA